MLSKAWDYIKLNNMIEKGDRIVVGVSGGADSICLLYVLGKLVRELEAALVVVHVNHCIRGEEADRDERFVEQMCSHMGIEFYRYTFDVKKLAKEQGLSEEEAGRNVRYEAFLDTCKTRMCNKIAVAHNKNDNAETVLFHLFRGTGIKGLSGIDPKRAVTEEFGEITIIRPLLCVERKEIEEFLREEGINYQIDSTNLTEDYTRNKIRNKILTYAVKEINSGAVGNISEAASQLREALEYMNDNIELRYGALVKQTGITYRISVKAMLAEPIVIQKGILLKIMENLTGKRKDLEAKHIEVILSLLNKQVGRYVHLPYRMIAEREYDDIKLFCEKEHNITEIENKSMNPIPVLIPGRVIIPQKLKIIETELIDYKKSQPIPKNSCAKWFDYDKIENAVEIRNRKEGDYIQINDSGGNKKLKDYFIDHKIPKKLRDSQILITDGNHVMWIPGEGERMSEKYKVGETTTRVLLMKMFDLEENENDR
ncbi:MAG: tRNA lysidine(34) synthetase TilS [Herbinix sp.]|nr:tRNA lysidine(34) synthetase TilS [Herbinix sp.]